MIWRCRPLLGTFVEIKVLEHSPLLSNIIEEAFNSIKEIDSLMNFFDEKSEVTKLNKEAYLREVKIDPQLFEVLHFALELSKISNGIFDITAHRSSKDKVSFEDIELLESFLVRFKKKLQIDLGGIAKGFAVDKAARILEKYDIKNYIINAGGDLRVGKFLQKIGIRNPKNILEIIGQAEIYDGSLATSSGYFSHQETTKNNQIKKFYPLFRKNCEAFEASEYKDESASVFAKDCITADALTKIVLLLKNDAKKILSHFNARAMMVNNFNQINFIN